MEGPSPGFFRARDINKSDIEAAIGKTVTAEAESRQRRLPLRAHPGHYAARTGK